MTKNELKAELDDAGVEYGDDARKDELESLYAELPDEDAKLEDRVKELEEENALLKKKPTTCSKCKRADCCVTK